MFGARPDAVEVSPGLLIGSAPTARQRRALARQGVSVVVDLRAESAGERCPWAPEVEVICLPVEDRAAPDPDQLAGLTSRIVDMISGGHRVFVHCQGGMGRSATVVCAVLMRMGWSLADAYRTLRQARPVVAPTDVQLALLEALERERHGPI